MASTPVSSMAAAVVDGRLRIRRPNQPVRMFDPTTFDIELLHATHNAIVSNIPLAVVVPLPGLHAPILLAASAVVAAITCSGDLNVHIGLAQPALTARQTYDQLHIRDQNLSQFIPRARINADGSATVVGSAGTGGRVDIATDYDRLAKSGQKYDAVLIDASTITPEQARHHLNAPDRPATVFLTADPTDPLLDTVRRADGLVWGWDADALSYAAAPAIHATSVTAGAMFADQNTLAAPSQAVVTIVAGTNTAADTALRDLRTHVRALGATYRSAAAVDVPALRWIWSVTNSLSMLAIPPGSYDRAAAVSYATAPLSVLASLAKGQGEHCSPGSQRAGLWNDIAADINTILVTDPGMTVAQMTADWLWDLTDIDDVHGVIVVRNTASVTALTGLLSGSAGTGLSVPAGWSDVARIVTVSDLAKGRVGSVDAICFTGALANSRANLLAVPPAPRVHVLTPGPFTAAHVHSQAHRASSRAAAVRCETVQVSAPRLQMSIPASAARPPTVVSEGVEELPEIEVHSEPFGTDLLSILTDRRAAGADRYDHDTAAPLPTGEDGKARGKKDCVHIEFVDGDGIFVPANMLLTVQRHTTLHQVTPEQVSRGDAIILVNRGARANLLDSVLETLADDPVYAAVNDQIRYWFGHVRGGYDTGLDASQILARMYGTTLTSEQTIRTWMNGTTAGPRDGADVRRFAKAIGDYELESRAEAVVAALNTRREIHRRLGYWIGRQVTASAGGGDDTDVVDESLGVRIGDITETLSRHVVDHVDLTRVLVPYALMAVITGSSS